MPQSGVGATYYVTGYGYVTLGDAGVITLPSGITGTLVGNRTSPAETELFNQITSERNDLQQSAVNQWTLAAPSPSTDPILTGTGAGRVILDGGTLQTTAGILTYRSFELGSGGGVLDVVTSEYYIAGNIGGSGTLTKTGEGLLSLAGDNTYTGGTKVLGGLLQGTTESLKGNIENHSAVLFNQATDGTYAGSLTGTGLLIKGGQGALKLTGDSSAYAGSTLVDQGGVVLAGALGGDVTVSQGAFLAGVGRIGGNLTNYGLVTPGNSPGTIRIGGNLTLAPAGTLQMQVEGLNPGQYDQLVVAGTATLGGTLQLELSPGISFRDGQSLKLVDAAGGLQGEFSSVVDNLGNALGYETVQSSGEEIEVRAVQKSFAPFAASANQHAVAQGLDSAIGDARAANLFGQLNALPGAALADAFDQIAPDELGAMGQMLLSYNTIQQTNLQRRLAEVRSGSTGFSANGFTLVGFDRSLLLADGGDLMAKQIASDPSKSPMRVDPDNRWGFFVTGTGQFGDVENNNGATGYDFTTGGMTLGMDYRVCPQWVVGASLGYAGSSANAGGSGGQVDANSAKASLYTTWFEKGFYANASVGGGGSSYDTERNVLGGKASGETSGGDFNSMVGGGYEFRAGNWTFGPATSLEYSYVDIGSYTESGSPAALRIQEQEDNSLRSRLGANASYVFESETIRIIPMVNLAWQHEFFNGQRSIQSRFANGAGGVFGVQTSEVNPESALAGVGVNVEWNRTWSTYLSYDSEVSSDFLTQSVNAGVKFKF